MAGRELAPTTPTDNVEDQSRLITGRTAERYCSSMRRLLMFLGVIAALVVIGLGVLAYRSSTRTSAPCSATDHGSSMTLRGGSGGCVHLTFPVSGSVNEGTLIDVESKMKRLGYTTFVCNGRPGATSVVCAARPK